MRLSPTVIARLAGRQSGAVTTRQLQDAGADRAWIARQVRSGHWQRLHGGVLVVHSGPVAWRTRAWAALLHAGPGATLSHDSAGFLHEFQTDPPRRIDVTIPAARRLQPTPGVTIRRRRTMPAGCGSPRRTWRGDTVVDLVAAATSDDAAVGWVCAAVRAGVRPPEIADALTRRPRMPNRLLLLDLLADVAAGIESPLERRYHRDVEHRHGLPRAALQVRDVLDGRAIRADCVYLGLGVRVELDGALAHPDGRTAADTWRDNAVLLARQEITLRYRWLHVAVMPCATAAQVAAALRAGGWRGVPERCGQNCSVA